MPLTDSENNDGGRDSHDFPIDDADTEDRERPRPETINWRNRNMSETTGLHLDDVLELLGNELRRLALSYISDQIDRGQAAIDVPDIVDYVHDGKSTDSNWKSTYVSLHQVHFPTLDDAGVIVYDEENRTIYLGENGEAVLATLKSIFDAWGRDEDAGRGGSPGPRTDGA